MIIYHFRRKLFRILWNLTWIKSLMIILGPWRKVLLIMFCLIRIRGRGLALKLASSLLLIGVLLPIIIRSSHTNKEMKTKKIDSFWHPSSCFVHQQPGQSFTFGKKTIASVAAYYSFHKKVKVVVQSQTSHPNKQTTFP